MKKHNRLITTTIILLLIISTTVTVFGASEKKPVYILTRTSGYGYNKDQTIDSKDYYKYKYDKNGLLKSVQYSDSYGQETKGTFVYNSKKQAIKLNFREYNRGTKGEKYCFKYTYNKNGYIRRIRLYWIDNGRYDLCSDAKLSWNKRGLLTKYTELDAKGNPESTVWYKYDKEGRLVKSYYSDSPTYREYTYDGNKGTEITYKDKSKKDIDTVTLQNYKRGNLIMETVFDGKDAKDKTTKLNYDYKKIKLSSKYRSLVLKQQSFLPYITW